MSSVPFAASLARRIAVPGHAPEDVVVDHEGYLLTGVDDGRILRVQPDTGAVQLLGHTGGRPLGLEVCPDGSVLVCDSLKGLLTLNPATGELRTLVREVDGRPLVFCSNVVRASDGTIYFSESTQRYDIHRWRHDMVEGVPTGRLFRRDVHGHVETLLDGLYFANGVALAPDESWLIVAESGGRRLRRVWLKGVRFGQSEIFREELPGYPDNISMSRNGLLWVSVAAPANPALDLALRLPLLVRKLVARLPEAVQPKPERTAWVMAFDAEGQVVHELRWNDADYGMVTGVCEHEGRVYMSSLAEAALLSCALA